MVAQASSWGANGYEIAAGCDSPAVNSLGRLDNYVIEIKHRAGRQGLFSPKCSSYWWYEQIQVRYPAKCAAHPSPVPFTHHLCRYSSVQIRSSILLILNDTD